MAQFGQSSSHFGALNPLQPSQDKPGLTSEETVSPWEDPTQVSLSSAKHEETASSVTLLIAKPRQERPSPSDVSQVRPWVRFWARGLDMVIYCGVFQLLSLGPLYAAYQINVFVGLIASFIDLLGILLIAGGGFVLFDAFFLNKTGTTPGKWLLKTRVTHQNGEHLSFTEATWRDLKMLWRGQALGVPILSLITMANAYGKLKEHGLTSWDRDGNFRVTHERIGTGRVWGILGGYLAFTLLINAFTHVMFGDVEGQMKQQAEKFVEQLGGMSEI